MKPKQVPSAVQQDPATHPHPIPPGATRSAFDRDRAEGHGGPPHTRLRDRHATGDGAEGGSPTGLVGDGEIAEGSERPEPPPDEPPYAGHSGGAVGGFPAEKRSTGGKIKGGIAPSSGTHNVDRTIGS